MTQAIAKKYSFVENNNDMKKTITLTFCLFAFTFLTQAQTNIPAQINSNQTWSPSGNPYRLTQNSKVDSGITLTILPGTIVQSKPGLKMSIDGELLAKGSINSKISFDSIELSFSPKCKGYDVKTRNGTQIDHCDFKNGTSTFGMIYLNDCSIKITNSSFKNALGGIYIVYGNRNGTILDKCTFNGFNSKSSFVIKSHRDGHEKLKILNCSFSNFNDIVTHNGNNTFENNIFDSFNLLSFSRAFHFKKNKVSNFDQIYFEAYDSCTITCNTFKNGLHGLKMVDEYRFNPFSKSFHFENNTLDSLGGTSPMIEYLLADSIYPNSYQPTTKIINNNFLTRTGTREKIIFNTTCSKKGANYLNLQSNYWGTTDSATIESYIYDNNDDTSKCFRANLDNFLLKPVSTCTNNTSINNQEKTSFNIYPNPTDGKIYIKSSNAISIGTTIHVMNKMGQIVLKETYEDGGLIDLGGLSNGIYFIQVKDSNKSGVTKVILNN